MSTYVCYYCPEKQSCFKNMILHLINCHEDDEIRVRKVDGHQMRTMNLKAIPDLCREQGRTKTIDEIKGNIHISRANVIPKDGPFKKRVRLQESSCIDDQHDPPSNAVLPLTHNFPSLMMVKMQLSLKSLKLRISEESSVCIISRRYIFFDKHKEKA
ncbi:hypothetical protein DPMN_082580 [Dreissena polymorpha]|uniref:Uncharacterized protein n=1 Tax=Dreissena polymorpha TaxID=45954 RepID=A0A9D4BHL2_DREPO|nr:hypothetical protein DPMN_082580 [Dreissena polymorpha]